GFPIVADDPTVVAPGAAAATCRGSWSILLRPSGRSVAMPGVSFQSRALGVTHNDASFGDEPQTVTAVGRIDGTSRDNRRPPGVADPFQISEHSVDPILANRRRNLLSHEDSGPAGTGESKKVGPQVPIVSLGFAFARDAERLAGWGARPKLSIVGPASKSG